MKIIETDRAQSLGWALHGAGAALAVIVVAAYYLLVFQNIALRAETDAQRIDQLNHLLSQAAVHQRENVRLQQELGALEEAVAAVRKRLPHELRQEEFTADLARVAESAGLSLEQLHWDPPQVSPSYAQAKVRVECSGSFASMCHFLDEVSRLTRITDVAQLRMDGDPEAANHRFEVNFILYYDLDSRDSEKNGGVL